MTARQLPLLVTLVLLCLAGSLGCLPAGAQERTLDAASRQRLVERVAVEIASRYVLAAKAREMEADLREHLRNGDYNSATTLSELCRRLTTDLQLVSGDTHLEVRHRDQPRAKGGEALNGVGRSREEQNQQGRLTNFGFEAVHRLPGNIGYLDLREFSPAEESIATAAAALAFLRNTDALIIDLRSNLGGTVGMSSLLSTVLLGSRQVLLNRIHFREGKAPLEVWTQPASVQRSYSGEVYLLTSRETYSMAEAFAYQLQVLRRATLVGERTAGGANLVEFAALEDQVDLRLSVARFVHPTTGSNWEGVGVKPDVETTADRATDTAHLMALQRIRSRVTDPALTVTYDRHLEALRRRLGLAARGR